MTGSRFARRVSPPNAVISDSHRVAELITPEQIESALHLFGWVPSDLARKAHLPLDSLYRIEKFGIATNENMTAIQQAFEAVGIEFIPKNGHGAGVRLSEARGAHDGSR